MKHHFTTVLICLMLVVCATTTNSNGREKQDKSFGQQPEIRIIQDLKMVSELLELLPRSETLVIFYIDVTLLTSPDLGSPSLPQFFGSDSAGGEGGTHNSENLGMPLASSLTGFANYAAYANLTQKRSGSWKKLQARFPS